jgi:hypothetical protein
LQHAGSCIPESRVRGLASILDLAGPFVRGGRAPDLAAADRGRDRVPFATVTRGRFASTMCLEPRGAGRWRLTRTVRRDDGLVATRHADLAGPIPLSEQEPGGGHALARP